MDGHVYVHLRKQGHKHEEHTDTRTCTVQSIFARIGCCIVITSAGKCMIAIFFLKQQQHIMNVNVHECALCVHETWCAWHVIGVHVMCF